MSTLGTRGLVDAETPYEVFSKKETSEYAVIQDLAAS